MNEKELLKLIEKGESENLELKLSLSQTKEVIQTISAFANKNGGKIIIGVSFKGEILGLQIGKDTIEKLTNKILAGIEPKIYPKIEIKEINNKRIIIIDINEAKEKPVFAFGRGFKRVGKSTLRMSKEEIERLILKRKKVYWDEQICEQANLSDIDEEKVKWFLKEAKYGRNFNIDLEISVKEALERLELIKNGKLTNAAILLFGKKPQKFFLQTETRCARFKGIEPLEFIDMKVFGGNIIDQRENALEFIKEHIKLHAKIVRTERIETWEYPIEAVREAITNALCHRDYEISSNVQIRIFDDRMEVWGCGPLPKPLKVEDLKKKHGSILRNPLIAKCFFLMKFIEQWGTGTNRIVSLCLKHNLPEPIFEEITEGLVVIFKKYKITEENLKDLNKRQKKAVEYLLKHKKITNKEYRQLNPDITDRTVLNDLNELINKDIVIAKGERKYRYYILQ